MHRYLNLFILTSALLSLLVAALFPPMTASASPLLAPTISATKTDTIIGDDGDGKADPGETIEYTVVINNSVSDATGVTFNDVLDTNVT
ncbi:MAG TPA: hypothetical protein VN653_15275, partial [Anaerolineales bacterium]|nr:hypothetical protein [Anaerolineales bacterium]